jgi:hypothetical protein
VRANAERQGQYRRGGEGMIPRERAKREFQVSHHPLVIVAQTNFSAWSVLSSPSCIAHLRLDGLEVA